ncbi:uncharacterized protein LOC132259032 isoform X2 [Phlebotomus argentipes]|uniref:uncharacterized protein LOC132259032 isoform X2 n=1 Tax=Phlebotomus argentipes TaxID=94469 RepID=UPI0028936759|nr:uncharacterized protein LOC132259032 isoform X2 [Phlebotomus argentipes]
MFRAIKRKWKTSRERPPVRNDGAGKSGEYDLSSQISHQPRYIGVQHGNIFLSPRPQSPQVERLPDDDVEKVENSSIPYQERISELEDAVCRLQKIVYQSQTGFSTAEKELLEQIDDMRKTQLAKDRRTMQICLEHRALQERFMRQERVLQCLQNENRSLHKRILQYEHCLDDVSKRVIDAIIAEDRLRAEFAVLKNRIRDLEVKNAAIGSMGSPARGRDEGYCTMSSGPLPSTLENLPEEPEQWILSDGGHSADMEDWSLSQEELVAQLEEDSNEWTWGNPHLTLLDDEIVYSESEELPCKDFTSDFYKLVSIQSESCKSLTLEDSDGKIDSDSDVAERGSSMSELGQEQMFSCSSSDESTTEVHFSPKPASDVQEQKRHYFLPKQWKRSSGWRKVSVQTNESTNVEDE